MAVVVNPGLDRSVICSRLRLQNKSERTEMKNPVNVLRLPRGPDPHGRGFDPSSPRYVALCPSSIPASAASCTDLREMEEEQRIRSELRERFLRTLIAMTNKHVHFRMYEKVQVQAKFGASDIDVLNFQVSDLQTPLGVQKEALLRCQDMISYSFTLYKHSSPQQSLFILSLF
ncbi:hypothetical protein QTP70_005196 [Hemibagrus guttatus]|uniref:Gem-associated protein 7 n=1 Tax=Hemibagrus guttatus TaxID=175788 RepID=A0AAE0RBI2_9TELE|nr:hypothetical protein QTP70_005196 [Hemibagrus guttatus]